MPRKKYKPTITESPTALEFFTNREDFIEGFVRYLTSKPDKGLPVLVYYGIGGCGKTLLQEKLIRDFCEPLEIPFARVDLRQPETRSADVGVLRIRQQLGRYRQRFNFTKFDLAYGYYWWKTRGTKPSKDNNFLPEEVETIADILAVMELVPLVGAVVKTGKLFQQVIKRLPWFRDWLEKRKGGEWLKEIKNLRDDLLLKKLPCILAQDLESPLKLKSKQEESGARAVIFFDTYEALWENLVEKSEGKRHEIDIWVRTLAEYLENTLVVIAGRDKLIWEKTDDFWSDVQHIDQLSIESFSESDSKVYLRNCGVDDKLHACLHRTCHGHPLYLGMIADIAQAQSAGGVWKPDLNELPVDTLQKVGTNLLNYLLRSISSDQSEAIKALSIPRKFDYEIFQVLGELFYFSRTTEAFKVLCSYSFVYPDKLFKHHYYLHELVRELMIERLITDFSESRITQAHMKLFEYHEKLEKSTTESKQQWHQSEKIYHLFHYNEKRAYDTLMTLYTQHLNCGHMGLLRQLLDSVPKTLGDSRIDLGVRKQRADYYRYVGMLDVALDLYRKVAEEAEGQRDICLLRDSIIGIAHSMSLKGQKDEAIEFLSTSLKSMRNLDDPRVLLDISEELYSINRTLDSESRKLKLRSFFLNFYEGLLSDSRKSENKLTEFECLRKLAHVCCKLGDKRQAQRYYYLCFKLSEKLEDTEIKSRLRIKLNYTFIGLLGCLEQYEPDPGLVLEKHQENCRLSEQIGDMLLIADVQRNYSIALKLLRRYDEALEKAIKSYELSKELKSNEQLRMACGLLATIQEESGNYEQALRFHKEHLILSQKAGVEGGLITSNFGMGRALAALGRLDEGLSTLNGLLEWIDKNGLAERNSQRRIEKALIVNELARIHALRNELDKSLQLSKLAVDLVQADGLKPALAEVQTNLAEIQLSVKDCSEALSSAKIAKEIYENHVDRTDPEFASKLKNVSNLIERIKSISRLPQE